MSNPTPTASLKLPLRSTDDDCERWDRPGARPLGAVAVATWSCPAIGRVQGDEGASRMECAAAATTTRATALPVSSAVRAWQLQPLLRRSVLPGPAHPLIRSPGANRPISSRSAALVGLSGSWGSQQSAQPTYNSVVGGAALQPAWHGRHVLPGTALSPTEC